MGSSKTYYYEAPAPEPDKSFEKYLQYQAERENRLADRADKESSYEKARTEAREKAGSQGLPDYFSNLKTQLSSGSLAIEDAQTQLRNYIDSYNLMMPGQIDVTEYPDTTTYEPPMITTVTTTTTDPVGTEGEEGYKPGSTTTVTKEEMDTTFQPPAVPIDYEWKTDPDYVNPQSYLDQLSDYYYGTDLDEEGNTILGTGLQGQQRTAGIETAYEDLLGRSATQEEISKGLQKLQDRAWLGKGISGLRDSIKEGSEYKKKFNSSYLANYYDTLYGPQTVDEEDNRTGKRKYNFDASLLPTYDANLTAKTGITTPDFTDYFSKALTVKELEEGTQNIRETRQYLYSAGLTSLQGDIDKETAKIKVEGQKDIAKIQADSNMMTSALAGFW